MKYNSYIKYIGSSFIGFIGYFIFGWINRKYAQSFRFGISDSDMILQAIYLLSGLIIACTALIIFSIKEQFNK